MWCNEVTSGRGVFGVSGVRRKYVLLIAFYDRGGMVNFFVFYVLAQYETYSFLSFDSEPELLVFLDANAGNHEFKFRVIEGREVEFVPVEIATAYKRK